MTNYDDIPHAPAPAKLVVVPFSTIERETLKLLWQRFPEHAYSMCDGDGGIGKSHVTIYVAAQVSTGREFAGEKHRRPPGAVLFLTVEDSPSIIRERLWAAGADLDRAFLPKLHVVEREKLAPAATEFTLPSNIGNFRDAIRQARAQLPDGGSSKGPFLLVIDPLMSFLDDRYASKTGDDALMRKVLEPLADLCETEHVTALVNRHINKNSGQEASMRGQSSVAIRNRARGQVMVLPHPEDKDMRCLVHTKSNYAGIAPTLQFRIREVPDCGCTRTPDEPEMHTRVEFLAEPLDMDANTILAQLEAKRRASSSSAKIKPGEAAEDFLIAMLSGRPDGVRSDRLVELAQRWDLCKKSTLYKAAERLGVDKGESVVEDGKERHYWTLPAPKVSAPLPDVPPEIEPLLRCTLRDAA